MGSPFFSRAAMMVSSRVGMFHFSLESRTHAHARVIEDEGFIYIIFFFVIVIVTVIVIMIMIMFNCCFKHSFKQPFKQMLKHCFKHCFVKTKSHRTTDRWDPRESVRDTPMAK